MRILFVCDGLGGGGKERRFVQMVKGLSERSYGELYIILTRLELAYEELESYPLNIIYLDRHQYGFFYNFYKLINNIRPDIVQVWSFVPMIYYNIIHLFSIKKPKYCISTAADCNFKSFPLWQKLLFKFSFKLAQKIVGNSRAGLDNYGVPEKKKICIYNGFDEQRLIKYPDISIRQQLGISTQFVVTMIASFHEGKDWEMFVKAAKLTILKNTDITFLAVGDGSCKKRIENLVTPKTENIIFTGRRNDVEAILRESDISVLCTNPDKHAEGVSNSILESCAFGVPVIATEGGGTSEIIENGNNGYIIPQKDYVCLSDRILYLLDNRNIRLNMGNCGKRIVEQKFALRNATKRYIDLFEDLYKS